MKKKIFFIVSALFFIIFLSVLVFVFTSGSPLKFFDMFRRDDAASTQVTDSTVKNVGFGNLDSYAPEYTPAAELFYTYMEQIVTSEGKDNVEYWKDWDWKTQLFFGEVTGFDINEKTVSIEVVRPLTIGNLSNSSMECSPIEVVRVSGINTVLEDTDFNLYDIISEGDGYYGYCLDDECSRLGKACVLLKKQR